MIRAKIKIDDKDILKEYINQKAELFVGYTNNKGYDAIEEPFFANVAKPNSKTFKNPMGTPRRYGRRKAISASDVAAFNEFGGGHTPPRPFLRTCFEKNVRKWNNFVRDRLVRYPEVETTFWKLGEKIKGDLSETVIGWTTPPNAPSTIKAKGFNNPLVDSGNMSLDFIEIQVNGVVGE